MGADMKADIKHFTAKAVQDRFNDALGDLIQRKQYETQVNTLDTVNKLLEIHAVPHSVEFVIDGDDLKVRLVDAKR